MSALIQVHNPDRMPLFDLWRLIFKFTFDKKSCAYSTKKTIEDNLLKWNGFIKMQKVRLTERLGPGFDGYAPVGRKGSVLDEYEYQVGNMCSWVVHEEKGEFQHLVDTYARHKIDYRMAEPQCRVFPEATSKRNYAKGRWVLRQAMKDNPNDYKPFQKGG